MMAPRSRPACFIGQARRLDAQSEAAWLEDKAFFYSAFHIDEVRLWSR
jgi:hypothetical protein